MGADGRHQPIDRRTLLRRAGALGISALVAPHVLGHPVVAGALPATRRRPAGGPAPTATPAETAAIIHDTLAGVTAFVVPGNDAYSTRQGVSLAEPGGVAAETPAFLAETLDGFFPAPEAVAFLVEVMQIELSATPLGGGLDAATWLESLIEHDARVPLTPVVVALLNMLAVQTDPTSVAGPFRTPFPRLSFAEKAQVWEELEINLPNLFTVDAPGSRLPGVSLVLPLLGTLGGLLRFASGAILELTAFGSYSEYAVFDPATRSLTGRPVGWQLSGYQPFGRVDGWNEMKGYYQGRRRAGA